MPTLKIDNQTVRVAAGATVLQAARQLGIHVPALCCRDGLAHVASCMLCVVEDCRDGRLHPACSTIVEDGMVVRTASETVVNARRMALDLILSDHVGDCDGPCHRACPAGMNIPAMIRAIAGGRLEEATRIVKRNIALPAALGRICPAPCEKACRRGLQDAAVGICRLKRFVADADLAAAEPYRPDIAASSGRRVAVVGAGPAGLAAAYYLMADGHECVIFEKNNRLGGGLRAAELQAALPADVLDAEIAQILTLGAELQTGVEVGRDVTLQEVRKHVDAVVLAVGELAPQAAIAVFGVEAARRGIKVDKSTYRTSDPSVFAGGSAILPGRLAVRAVAHGHAVAASVSQMLAQAEIAGLERAYSHRLTGTLAPEELSAFLAAADPGPHVEPEDRIGGQYSLREAMQEAARCMHCDCRKSETCKLRRYAGVYGASQRHCRTGQRRPVEVVQDRHVVYEPGKCIACGICVRITEKSRDILGLNFVGRGFDVRVRVPFNESLENGLGEVAVECVQACPTGALAFGGDKNRTDVDDEKKSE